MARPSGTNVLDSSTVRYVKKDAATGALSAHEMACYATPKGQAVQIEAMQNFRERHPHVSLAKVVSVIDAGVQRHIANLRMRGATADAAALQACKKSPELYALSLVEGAASVAGVKPEGGGKGGGQPNGKKSRTADEEKAVQQRRVEQMQREISNLKSGKKPGKGGGAPGKGGGPPPATNGPTCAADVCKDFNFKAVGCQRASCSFKHVCCVCGANHPWKGNH